MRLQWGLPYIGLPSASNQGGTYTVPGNAKSCNVTLPITAGPSTTLAAVHYGGVGAALGVSINSARNTITVSYSDTYTNARRGYFIEIG